MSEQRRLPSAGVGGCNAGADFSDVALRGTRRERFARGVRQPPECGALRARPVQAVHHAVGRLDHDLCLPVAIRLGEPHPFPFLCRRPERLRGIALSAALGCILGVLSALLFLYLRVDPGEFLRKAQQMLPGVDFDAPAYILGISLPALLSAAIAEELLFRGIIQRWLERKLGGTESSGWAAVALTSALWAAAHVGNVEQVGLKLGQIFILGLFFGTLARKFSVEASMGAHVMLNLMVILVVAGMQLQPFG